MYKHKFIKLIAVVLLIVTFSSFAFAAPIMPYENIAFESTSVIVDGSMGTLFLASTNVMCTKIYVSSCQLEKKNSNGTWSKVVSLTAPSDVAKNACNFSATGAYSSSCSSGNTYRITATFRAVYNSKTYTTTGSSSAVSY